MTRRLIGVLAVGFFVALIGCDDSSPVAPTPPESPAPPAAPIPTNIVLAATPERLPSAGGDAEVLVRVIRRANGSETGVGGVLVKVTGLDGELSAAELTTNDNGDGVVRWTSRTTGTVVARTGTLSSQLTIPVDVAPLPPIPPTTPRPNPSPAPTPIPPSPNPTPQPIAITLTPTPATPTTADTVTWTAVATIPASEGTLRQYEWTFDGAAPIINSQNVMTRTYSTTGAHTASVTVRTTTWANGTANGSVTVNTPPPPALSVTLAADDTEVATGTTVNFTATPANLASGETVVAYQWDLDGNGTFEGTSTTVNTRANPYATAGVYNAKVKILTSSERTAEGTRRVIVTN